MCTMLWFVALIFAAAPSPAAFATNLTPGRTNLTPSATNVVDLPSASAYLAGVVGAFVLHEAGHIGMNLALGNTFEWVSLKGFGFVPFFAISPNLACDASGCLKARGEPFGPGRRGMYLISTAGFDVQHLGSEIILTTDPWLRYHVAPMRKGFLTFNVLLSLGYAIASMLAIEDAHGDAGGAARAANVSPFIFSSVLMLPALLDIGRFYFPDASGATWLSRGSKAAIVGLAFTF